MKSTPEHLDFRNLREEKFGGKNRNQMGGTRGRPQKKKTEGKERIGTPRGRQHSRKKR